MALEKLFMSTLNDPLNRGGGLRRNLSPTYNAVLSSLLRGLYNPSLLV